MLLEQLNAETEKKMKEVEAHWQNQVAAVRASLDAVKEQMERESQQKIEALIQQHRAELGECQNFIKAIAKICIDRKMI